NTAEVTGMTPETHLVGSIPMFRASGHCSAPGTDPEYIRASKAENTLQAPRHAEGTGIDGRYPRHDRWDGRGHNWRADWGANPARIRRRIWPVGTRGAGTLRIAPLAMTA